METIPHDDTKNTTELQIVDTHTPAATARFMPMMPQNLSELMTMAKLMAGSRMFAVSTPEQAAVILMTGMELGFSPVQSFRGIHVISGKPCLSADLMIAACLKQTDLCERFVMLHSDDKYAEYETKRSGADPVRLSFTMADAETAGLLKQGGNWTKYPKAMLRARCISALGRIVYPDLLLGLYDPDEIQSFSDTEDRAPRAAANATFTTNRPADAEDPKFAQFRADTSRRIKDLPKEIKDTIKAMVSEFGVDFHALTRAQIHEINDAINRIEHANDEAADVAFDDTPAPKAAQSEHDRYRIETVNRVTALRAADENGAAYQAAKAFVNASGTKLRDFDMDQLVQLSARIDELEAAAAGGDDDTDPFADEAEYTAAAPEEPDPFDDTPRADQQLGLLPAAAKRQPDAAKCTYKNCTTLCTIDQAQASTADFGAILCDGHARIARRTRKGEAA